MSYVKQLRDEGVPVELRQYDAAWVRRAWPILAERPSAEDALRVALAALGTVSNNVGSYGLDAGLEEYAVSVDEELVEWAQFVGNAALGLQCYRCGIQNPQVPCVGYGCVHGDFGDGRGRQQRRG